MEDTFWAMDTYVRVRVYSASRKRFEKIVDELRGIAHYIESELDFHSSKSALAKLNASGRSTDMFLLSSIMKALEMARLTNGAYDPTIGSVEPLWDFENGVIPPERKLKEALRFVGFAKVEVSGNLIRLPEGVRIDLGGIAKGIFLDMAYHVFSRGKVSAVLEAGGEVLLCGYPVDMDPKKQDRGFWAVAIRNPRGNGFIKIIKLQKGFTWFVATSGDYERFFIRDGIRYHHVLDPATGRPAKYAASATVVATSGYVADAVATALMVSPPDFLKQEPLKSMVVQAYIYREGKGLKKVFY